MTNLLFNLILSFTNDIIITQIIVCILYFLLGHLVAMIIACNIDKIVYYLIIVMGFINLLISKIIYFLASRFLDEINYTIFYNNELKKRGHPSILLIEMDSINKDFNYLTSNKYDLYSAFMFIFMEIKYGPLSSFCRKNSMFEIDILYKTKDTIKKYNIEYMLSNEKEDPKYLDDKLEEISDLFEENGDEILNSCSYTILKLRIR